MSTLIEPNESSDPTDVVKSLTSTELKRGYFLGRGEITVFDPNSLDRGRMASASFVTGGERQVKIFDTKPVAEVVLGDVRSKGQDAARVTIREDLHGRMFAYVEGTDVYEELLPPSGEYDGFLVGREVPGQDTLGGDVSREHCILGLSEEGHIVIQNLHPANDTVVKGFGEVVETNLNSE